MHNLENFLWGHEEENNDLKEDALKKKEQALEEWKMYKPPLWLAMKQLEILCSDKRWFKKYPESQLFVADFLSRFFEFLKRLDSTKLKEVLENVEDLSEDIKKDIIEAFEKYWISKDKFWYSMLVGIIEGKDTNGHIVRKTFEADDAFPYVDESILDANFKKGFFLPSISWVKNGNGEYILYSVVLWPKSTNWLKFYISPYIKLWVFKWIDVDSINERKYEIIKTLDGWKSDYSSIFSVNEILGWYFNSVKEIILWEHTYLGFKWNIIVDNKEETINPIRFNTWSNSTKLIEVSWYKKSKVRALEVDDKNTISRVTVTLKPVVFVEKYRRVRKVESYRWGWWDFFSKEGLKYIGRTFLCF